MEHLIQWLNSGDPRRINEALKIIEKEMKSSVLRRTRSYIHIDENEIWNIALKILWEFVNKKTFENRGPDSIQRFLCRICNIVTLTEYRKSRRYNTLPNNVLSIIPDDFDVEAALYEIQLLELVKGLLLAHLNKTEVEILVNKFYLDMSYKEMAANSNKSEDTLKTTKYRTVDKLKKILREHPELRKYLSQLLCRRKAVA